MSPIDVNTNNEELSEFVKRYHARSRGSYVYRNSLIVKPMRDKPASANAFIEQSLNADLFVRALSRDESV